MAEPGRDGKPRRRSRRGRGEESDGCTVPVKPRTKPTTNRWRRWWREGGRPEGRRAATHAPDSVPDSRTPGSARGGPGQPGPLPLHFLAQVFQITWREGPDAADYCCCDLSRT